MRPTSTPISIHSQGSRSSFRHPFPQSGVVDLERMRRLVERHWKLNRTAVSPDTDRLVDYLREELGARVLEAECGEECLTWIIPRRWQVRRGQLRRKDGEVVADFAENPLHLWTHSVSFRGEIGRDELLGGHVCTDPRRPDEIPYHYRNGYRFGAEEWGFSLPYRTVARLTDPIYLVEIDADLDCDGTLKVVDAFLPGDSADTVFVMAHTCHPAQVADGLACIAVAVELFHHLRALSVRKLSYRFLFGPEYFGGAAYLAKAGSEVVDRLRFGLFLDMLSNHEPIGFQRSLQGDSRLDRVVGNVLSSHAGTHLERPYRKLWGNDETFYNGPGYEIPTVGLARGMSREYHYDSDNLANMNPYHLVESAWILRRIAEVFETDYVPERLYSGPLYLSRYDLYVDPVVDPRGADSVEKLQVLADGHRSCMDIAHELGIDFFFVREFFDALAEESLVRKMPREFRGEDRGSLARDAGSGQS